MASYVNTYPRQRLRGDDLNRKEEEQNAIFESILFAEQEAT